MEKERNLQRIPFRKKILFGMGAAVLAVSLSSSGDNNQAEGKAPYKSKPYEGPLTLVMPLKTAEPVRIFDRNINVERKTDLTGENRDNIDGEINPVDVFSSQISTPEPSIIPIQIASPSFKPATSAPKPEQTKKPSIEVSSSGWSLDPHISFFGPGLYGRRTACGLELTKELIGVASRTLSCGTPVTFMWNGKEVTVPVVDWGPAKWTGRIFDLTGGACMAFKTPEQPKGHCFTGPINYKIGK